MKSVIRFPKDECHAMYGHASDLQVTYGQAAVSPVTSRVSLLWPEAAQLFPAQFQCNSLKQHK
jgi:hypothetical protein